MVTNYYLHFSLKHYRLSILPSTMPPWRHAVDLLHFLIRLYLKERILITQMTILLMKLLNITESMFSSRITKFKVLIIKNRMHHPSKKALLIVSWFIWQYTLPTAWRLLKKSIEHSFDYHIILKELLWKVQTKSSYNWPWKLCPDQVNNYSST